MSASSDTEFSEMNTIQTNYGELIKSALIFGANSSGKTNFVKVLSWIKNFILTDTSGQSKMVSRIPNFAFNDLSKEQPTAFEVQFIINDVLYEYGFELLNEEVVREYLNREKDERIVPVFERTSPDFEDICFAGETMDNVRDLAKNTRRDNLFLYWANAGNNELAIEVCRWFSNVSVFTVGNEIEMLTSTIDYLEQATGGKEKILNLLNQVDIDILDFDVEMTKVLNMRGISLTTHRKFFSTDWEEIGSIPVHIDLESSGTKKMFEIAGSIIDALEKGKVIFIDEIDSRLHPLLVRHLIMKFNSISQNHSNAQLICTTHDALLLDEDIRRDQIYFTEKNEYGVSQLYALTDFIGVIKSSKLLKRYLIGIYGAVPNIRDYLIPTLSQMN